MKWMGFLNFMATTSDILSFKDEENSLKEKINEIFFPLQMWRTLRWSWNWIPSQNSAAVYRAT